MTAAEVVERLGGGRKSGTGWSVVCPAHDDSNPSLSVSEGNDGGVVLHCHRGCSFDEIIVAAGIDKLELAPPSAREKTSSDDWSPAGRVVARYRYTDANGKLLFEVVRAEGKKFLQRRPDASRKGGWDWRLGEVERPLYRLPEVLEGIRSGATVFVCEGEKDVEAARAVGAVATCNPHGAGKWRPEHSKALKGGDVIVVADRDEPGRKHANDVRNALAGIAARVRIAEAVEGKDVTDHLASGHTLEELAVVSDTATPTVRSALALRWLTEAIAEPPPEPPVLISGMMRAGELVVLGAPRAIGKSWLAKNAAVLLGRGEGYLGGALPVARPARVLLCHGEIDQWEASRRWRMLAGTDGPPERVAETFERWRLRTVRKRSSSGGSDDGSRWSESDEWIDAVLDSRLEETIAEHRFDVLIIDPWAVFFSGAENSNDEVEAALDKLRDLAMRHQCAVWILHHLGKATDAREPEDLWRGASRLADWASTRITLLPHYTEKQAEQQGMTRQQARRYVDVRFLRRSTPTDDFSMRLDAETGWWERWVAPEQAADARRIHLDISDVVDACRASGGAWTSQRKAADDLGISVTTAGKLLSSAVRHGAIETAPGERGATVYRLPAAHLADGFVQ